MAKQVLTDLDFNGVARGINVPSPTASHHIATRGYVDSVTEGLSWKDSVRVRTTSNINLASPGASLDGITMATNDRVLLDGQTAATEKGIYIWNGAAVAMTRALDASTSDELEQAIVTVEEGTSTGSTFRQTAVNFILDSGPVVWTNFGTMAAAATETNSGIAEIATQAETDTGTDDLRFVTPLKLATWAGRIRKYATSIGDGSATQYTVTHNLNTRDVQVGVYRNTGAYDEVFADVEHTTINTLTIRFAAAPNSNQFRVVVIS